MNFNKIDTIARQYGTPYYLMDGDTFVRNITNFRKAFTRRYDKVVVGYSFKTNYVPALCKLAKEAGCVAEVVSEMEYQLAKHIGYEQVIYNGPIKKEGSLRRALEDGAVVNIDSHYEIDAILAYRQEHPNQEIKVGLRLNIDLTGEDGVSRVQNGLRVGRFGFSREMMVEVISVFQKHDIQIVSLHGHTSSSDRAVVNYSYIARQMLQVCEHFSLDKLKYFDVGGGFFGAAAKGIDVSAKPKYQDYADCIVEECFGNEWFDRVRPYIVIEPGVSVVANVFSYVSKIFQTKEIAGQSFVTTDGTVFDVKPTMHNNNLPHSFYCATSSEDSYKANLVGSTCMEKDIILNQVSIPCNIAHGDYVKIDGVGAYTIVLTPTFINYISPILEVSNENVIGVVRRRQTLGDVMALYNI